MFSLSKNCQQRVNEVYRPSLAENLQLQEKTKKLCEEYAKLVFACERLINSESEVGEAKVDIGMRFYMNVEVRDTRHVIVNLGDDIYAKLPIEKAIVIAKNRMEALRRDLSMYVKQNSVKSMMIVARRGKKRANMSPEALSAFTTLVNLLIKETLTRCAQTAANTGDKTITKQHFQRIVAQIMLDFNA